MPKYETGSYFVYFFDRYGGRVKDKTLSAPNFTQACALGEEHKGEGSFVAVRVLYNSLDPHPTVVPTIPEEEA
jgi:hypothetical protein